MVAVPLPTLAEEDAKRPIRERDRLVVEATRLVNRMTSLLALPHRHPQLQREAEAGVPAKLASLRTAEGEALPPNTLAEPALGLHASGGR